MTVSFSKATTQLKMEVSTLLLVLFTVTTHSSSFSKPISPLSSDNTKRISKTEPGGKLIMESTSTRTYN